VKRPRSNPERTLVYGVRSDATWGPVWTDGVEQLGTSPEPSANLRQRRQYRGDEYGDVLVAWLNEMAHSRHNRSAYQRMSRLLKTVLQSSDVSDDPAKLKKVAMSIEEQLRRYSVRPKYFAVKTREVNPQGEAPDRARPFFQVVPSGGQSFREQAAVSAILELAQSGLLSNVRRCDWRKCRGWLYARYPHHRFCSEQCKNGYYSTKAFKVEHAAKQKKIDDLRRSGKVIGS